MESQGGNTPGVAGGGGKNGAIGPTGSVKRVRWYWWRRRRDREGKIRTKFSLTHKAPIGKVFREIGNFTGKDK